MVSYAEIIKRLIPGHYSAGYGYPGSEEDEKYFLEKIRKKVPELRDKDDDEVYQIVEDAIDWFMNNFCKPIMYDYGMGLNKLAEGGVFECFHPAVGKVYLSFYEFTDSDNCLHSMWFRLTRSRRQAGKDWDDIVNEINEEVGEEEEEEE